MYLLLTLGLLLLNKICLTAYVFKLLHILQETGRKLNVHKYYKSSMSGKIACCMKVQNNVFGKSHDYNTTMSRQEKRQRAGSSLKEGLDKKNITPPATLSLPKYCTYCLYYELL